jgi:hypothetical protein
LAEDFNQMVERLSAKETDGVADAEQSAPTGALLAK